MARWEWLAIGLIAWSGPVSAQTELPLVVTFAGDLMAHARNQSMPDYDDIYRGLAPWLLADDLKFVNLETPVEAERPSQDYPSFNAKPAYVEAAIRGGFNVFSLANNHANDYGADSVNGTLRTFETLGRKYPVAWSGLRHIPAEPIMPVLIERPQWRVGFVALTNVINQTRGEDQVNLVNLWDVWSGRINAPGVDALVEKIRQWKTGVDVLIVSLHDGIEYTLVPDPAQVAIYRRLVVAGVDVLWCNHPHVLLPWAWVTTDRGPRLVMFSMGNFVSRQTGALTAVDAESPQARTGDGALMRVRFSRVPKTGVRLLAMPLLTSNFNDPVRGTIAMPTEVLVEHAPGAWKTYFRRRLELQKMWLTPNQY
jgi:poly-gamma-glutamate synthesis protein (capsule biosynthesis protein)